MGKIVAIGGGENGRGEHPYETGPFDREIVRLTDKDNPNFLFIGLANSFADSYYATMCDIFHGRLGAPIPITSPKRISVTRIPCAGRWNGRTSSMWAAATPCA